jgi:hypothetical protein
VGDEKSPTEAAQMSKQREHRTKPTREDDMSIDLNNLRRTGGIIKLQGKEFITFAGLLVTAHSNGLRAITPTLLEYNAAENYAVFSAVAQGERGSYTAHGDADKSNVKRGMHGAILRMAETRAVCRALRMYLGIGMTAREELPGTSSDPAPKPHWSAAERQRFLTGLNTCGVSPHAVTKYLQREQKGHGGDSPASWSSKERADFLAAVRAGKIPDLR